MISRPAVSEPKIIIHAPNEDRYSTVDGALSRIRLMPAGKALLDEIRYHSTDGKRIVIEAVPFSHNSATPDVSDKQAEKMTVEQLENEDIREQEGRRHALKRFGVLNGSGSSAHIRHNPKFLEDGVFGRPHQHYIENYASYGMDNNDSTLYNNLVHAMRMLKGTYTDDLSFEGKEDEEIRGIGVGKYEGFPISENQYRQQIGIPLRAYYPVNPNR